MIRQLLIGLLAALVLYASGSILATRAADAAPCSLQLAFKADGLP